MRKWVTLFVHEVALVLMLDELAHGLKRRWLKQPKLPPAEIARQQLHLR